MSTGFRFRAYPDKQVAGELARWIGCQRFIYNAKVREDRYFRAFQRRLLAFAGQHAPIDQAYSHLIGDGCGNEDANTTWLREVPSHVLRNGAVRFFKGYQRFFKGLAGRPTIKRHHGEQSVWLTSELFEFVPITNGQGPVGGYTLRIGTKKFPCGQLPFVVSPGRERGADGRRLPMRFEPPASIYVSINAGCWYLSFSNEGAPDQVIPTEHDTLDYLRSSGAAALAARTIGLDRGVAVPLMAAGARGNAQAFTLLQVHQERLAKKEVARKRWQRRAARRVKGSANRRKACDRAAKAGRYAADVRENFAHQTSHALIEMQDLLLYVFEALRVKNMTASAAGTPEAPGTNVAQKSGLNRSILASAWGLVKQYTKYKAIAAGKLCIEVPPGFSSQECSACGHTHADNRPSQAEFVCQRCEYAENADVNAARVLARRGVEAIVSGSYTLREKKKVGSLRRAPSSVEANNVGSERSEVTPVETVVSRARPRPRAQMSLKQETHATALGA